RAVRVELVELVEGGALFRSRWRRAQRVRVAQCRRKQVRVDTDQALEFQAAHRVRDLGADIAALRHVSVIPQALHELVPGPPDPDGPPPQLGWLVGEAVA